MNIYLNEHILKYPQRTYQDDLKWYYQAILGCEHFVSDFEGSLKRIKSECGPIHLLEKEVLSDAYLRIHFSGLSEIEAKVLNRLFIESATLRLYEKRDLTEAIKKLKNQYPSDIQKEIDDYLLSGCPSVHHSELFRENYDPHYRVIYRAWWPYFDLLCQIEQNPQGIIGIDGRCGSGKSTLGELISHLYHCPLIHMDDFYLPQEMRTQERLTQPGGNVHYERFKKEVMESIQRKEPLHYGIFDHRIMNVGSYQDVPVSNLYVIEGSYAFHPTLINYYHLKIFLTIFKDDQKQRIIKRNGMEIWKMFESRWIPLEENYFAQRDFEKLSDISINVSQHEDFFV